MAQSETNFERRKELTIIALLQQPTIGQAAAQAEVSERTLWRWLQDPDFQREYREARRQALNHAITRLHQRAAEAAETLAAIMADPENPATTRINAARSILEFGFKGSELAELEERLEKLEEKAGEFYA